MEIDNQKTPDLSSRVFLYQSSALGNADRCAPFGFASKFAFFDATEGDYAILFGVDGEVATDVCTFACNFGCASLAYEYFASANFLTTKAFDA